MDNARYNASDFRARVIPARELQTDDDVLSDDLDVVKIMRRRRTTRPPTGGKTVAFIGYTLRIVGSTSTTEETVLEYGINETVLLLSRHPEPDYVADSV